MMSQRDFTRGGIDVATQQSGVTGGMMWCAKRAACDQGLSRRKQANNAVDLCGLERFFQREWRQNRSEPFRKHGFTGARRSYKQGVMTSACSYFECPFDIFLAFDLSEVDFIVVVLIKDSAGVDAHRRDGGLAFKEANG